MFISFVLIYMNMKHNWRDRIDPFLRTHLESQLRETMKYRDDYKHSKDPSKAQLWIAIANLSRQLFNVSVKLNYMERFIQEKLTADSNRIVPKEPVKKLFKKIVRKNRKVRKTVKKKRRR